MNDNNDNENNVPKLPVPPEWLAKTRSGTSTVRSVANELRGLSRAFYATGNHTVAEQLEEYAVDLSEAEEQITDGVGENINLRYDESRKQTNQLMAIVFKSVLGSDKPAPVIEDTRPGQPPPISSQIH